MTEEVGPSRGAGGSAGRPSGAVQPVEVPAPLRGHLRDLFRCHRTLRPVLDAVLDGHLGRVTVPEEAADPEVALAEIGCYCFPGGDPSAAALPGMLGSIGPPRELVVADARWRTAILGVFGPAVTPRPMRSFAADAIDRAGLREVLARRPADTGIVRLDVTTAAELDRGLEPHGLQTFASPADLVARGIGFGVRVDGRLVAAATSYALAGSGVEIAIATRPEARGRGHATLAAAAMIDWCLGAGLVPCWNASNPVSQRLAVRLGFRPAGEVDILYLPGTPA